jgi:hypothetical protein
VVDKGGGIPRGLVAGDQPADRIPGRGVDRGELPDRPDAFELADVEDVQGDQVTRAGGEVAESEQAILSVGGDDAGGGSGELGQRRDPLSKLPGRCCASSTSTPLSCRSSAPSSARQPWSAPRSAGS